MRHDYLLGMNKLHLLTTLGMLFTIACSDDAPLTQTPPGGMTKEQWLGQQLFEDSNLSEPAGQSCASCHDPKQAFTGNAGSSIEAVALGSRPNIFGGRNVPTAMYAMYAPAFGFAAETDGQGMTEHVPTGGQFWDGRADDLEAQARGPFLNPREMNNADAAAVVAKVGKASYAGLFREVYGENALNDSAAAYIKISEAIAAYERTEAFAPFASRFDDYLKGKEQLTADELAGFELFKNKEKGNCIACHTGNVDSKEPKDWLFTDFTYDALGVPRNPDIPDNADAAYFDLGLCKQEGLADKAPAGVDTEAFCGAFKVPTLRNIEKTAPYMHNGAIKTLREVVQFYVTRDTSPEQWYPSDGMGGYQKFNDLPMMYHANVNTSEAPYDKKPGEMPRLSDSEIDSVVAFLKTLTDR